MINFFKNNPLKLLNVGLLFEQQHYLLPVMLFFYLENGLTVSDYILFQSISYILYVVLGVPAGYVSDHFSKKYILIIGCFLNLLRVVLWLSCTGYYVVLLGEALMVIVRLFTTGMTDSYVYEYLHEQGKTRKVLSSCGAVVAYTSFGVALASLASPFAYKMYGIYFLLFLELIMIGISICMLCFLPKTSVYNRQKYSVSEIKKAFVSLVENKYLRQLIIYNVAMFVTTSLFVSTFQPLMKASSVPVVLFGFVYFFNQSTRAVFGRLVKRISEAFSLSVLLSMTSCFILFGFVLEGIAFNWQNECFTLGALFFVCLTIGMQLANQVININEIHKYVASNLRATSVSVFNMLCRGTGGAVLALFKNVYTKWSFSTAFVVFGLIFMFISLYMWKKVRFTQKSLETVPELCRKEEIL